MMEILERKLDLNATIMISLSAMLGPGIFILPGVVYVDAGSSLWLFYFLAMVCVLPASFAIVELATAMPSSGGAYVYIERTFGPLAGIIAGFGLWFALLFKAAFALVGIGAYIDIFINFPIQFIAIGFLLVTLIMNVFGMGKMSDIISIVVIIAALSLTLLSSWTLIDSNTISQSNPLQDNFTKLLATTATIVVSYAGALKVAAIAGEVKDPDRNLPKAIIFSILIVGALYILVSLAYSEIRSYRTSIDGVDLHPIFSLATYSVGNSTGLIISGIAIITMVLMANAGVLAGSRFPFAMSRDNLLISILGKLHSKFLTPVPAIGVSCGFLAMIILLLDVDKLAKFASVFLILVFVVMNFTVIILRETRVQWYKPGFATPIYPWLPLFGIITGLLLLLALRNYLVVALLLISVPSILTYLFYSRKRVHRKGVMGFRGSRKDLITTRQTTLSDYSSQTSMLRRNRMQQTEVAVCLYGKERSPDTLIELGIAVSSKKALEVVHLTEIPEQTSPSDIQLSKSVRSLARRIRTMSVKNQAKIFFDPVTSHDIYATVFEISQRLSCTWLIKEWGGRHFGTFTFHDQVGWLEQHLGCHLITFFDAGIRYFRKILVYIEKDQIIRLPIQLAYEIAKMHEADEIMLLSFIDQDGSISQLQKVWNKLSYFAQPITDVETSLSVVPEKNCVERVIELSEEYDLLIILHQSTTTNWFVEKFMIKQHDKIISNAACSVINLSPSMPLIKKDFEDYNHQHQHSNDLFSSDSSDKKTPTQKDTT